MTMKMQQRRSAKALADPAQWRSRVRSECLQRVKDQRAGLLWRLRQVSPTAFSTSDPSCSLLMAMGKTCALRQVAAF